MDIHPAFAAEFAAEAKRLRDKYTAPLNLSVAMPPYGADPETFDAFAWTMKRGDYPVTLNARWFGPFANPAKTRAEFAKMTVEDRSVERAITDTLTHEYGHVLSDHLHSWQWMSFAEELQRYLRRSVETAHTERQLFAALSQYGLSSATEASAESFVLMDRGADHPAARIAEKYLGKFRR